MATRIDTIRSKQKGAALVEFAVTVSLFLIVVFGIMEFSILIMNVSRANELTRESSRIAIIGSPVCDIWGGG
ncbi:MAG: pilus assembly protein, partial [Gammaproteobacteria bacterium]|nr:pilus assembly protein [Gammaproteobacteria bacterium]